MFLWTQFGFVPYQILTRSVAFQDLTKQGACERQCVRLIKQIFDAVILPLNSIHRTTTTTRDFSHSLHLLHLFICGREKTFHCYSDRDFFLRKKGKNIYFLFHCWSRFPFRWFSSSVALVYLFTYFYRRFGKFYLFFKKGVEEKNDFDSTSRFVKY